MCSRGCTLVWAGAGDGVWCGCDLHPATSSHPASLPGTVASTQPRLASWHGGWGHQGLTLNSGLPRHFKSCIRCTCDELFTVDCAAAAGSSLQPEAAGLPSLGPARPPASNVQQQLGFYTKAFCTFYWLDTWIYLSSVFIFAYNCLFYGRCFGSITISLNTRGLSFNNNYLLSTIYWQFRYTYCLL